MRVRWCLLATIPVVLGCRNVERDAINLSHAMLLREARKDLREERYDAAIRKLERAAALKPAHAATHFRLANALVARARQSDVDEATRRRLLTRALAEHKKALELAPKVPQAHYHVGRDLILLGRPTEAIPYLEKALQLDPNSPFIYARLGDAYRAMGKYRPAVEYYLKGLEKPPQPFATMELHEGLAEAYLAIGQRGEALAEFELALKKAPSRRHVRRLEKRIAVLRGKGTTSATQPASSRRGPATPTTRAVGAK